METKRTRPYDGSAPARLADFGPELSVEGVSDYRSAFFWKRIAGPTTVTVRAVQARRRNFWRGRVEAAMRHDRVLQARTDARVTDERNA